MLEGEFADQDSSETTSEPPGLAKDRHSLNALSKSLT